MILLRLSPGRAAKCGLSGMGGGLCIKAPALRSWRAGLT